MPDYTVFGGFVPTNSLAPADRVTLARHAQEIELRPGNVLFRRGEPSRTLAFLAAGEIELADEAGSRRVAAGSERARHPLCGALVREVTATCTSQARVIMVDRDQLDLLLTWAQTGAIEVRDVDEEADGGDWMSVLLRNPTLHRIPAGNIAQVIASVEQVDFEAGADILREGEPGDCYYVVVEGQCEVLRSDARDGSECRINLLQMGSGFGEEALVSGLPRNATVRALTNCTLARLTAGDFRRLLQEPVLRKGSLEALPDGARLIDVRLPEEFGRGHLPGAINLPLRDLRQLSASLDPGQGPLLVYCDSGRRSASAAFLLSERGFEVHWLAAGVTTERMVESAPGAGAGEV